MSPEIDRVKDYQNQVLKRIMGEERANNFAITGKLPVKNGARTFYQVCRKRIRSKDLKSSR